MSTRNLNVMNEKDDHQLTCDVIISVMKVGIPLFFKNVSQFWSRKQNIHNY